MFFFGGVAETGEHAFQTASRLNDLFKADQDRIAGIGRAAHSARKLHRHFQAHPVGSVRKATASLNLSIPTLHSAAKHPVRLGILRELLQESDYLAAQIAETQELTTQAAANILGVSRPHLIKLLETAQIPFHRVGAHRRIRMKDLIGFQQKRDENRRQALDELARRANEAGLYRSPQC